LAAIGAGQDENANPRHSSTGPSAGQVNRPSAFSVSARKPASCVCRNDAKKMVGWRPTRVVWRDSPTDAAPIKPELDRSEISGRYCLEVTTVHHRPFQEDGPAFVSIPADWSIEGAVWVAENHFRPVPLYLMSGPTPLQAVSTAQPKHAQRTTGARTAGWSA
jgi:hypothetical protein